MARSWLWRIPVFEEIRREGPVQNRVIRELEDAASAAGPGYEARYGQGETRFRGVVLTVRAEAMVDNARHNTLLRVSGR